MHYLRHYLSRVTFQANFNIESLKIALHPTIIEVCERLTIARMTKQDMFNVIISTIPNQPGGTQKFPTYVFDGQRYRVQIQNNILNIQDKNYTNHESFHAIIGEIFNAFNSIYNRPPISRLSLRYANNISFPSGDTFDFSTKINNSLLNATLLFRELGLTRSLGIMNIHGEDDINVTFTYGYLNPEYPNRIAKREFVLDYDCFILQNSSVADIIPILLQLRAKVNQLFEMSILPELRTEMEPQN